jgi:hypothetical protein
VFEAEIIRVMPTFHMISHMDMVDSVVIVVDQSSSYKGNPDHDLWPRTLPATRQSILIGIASDKKLAKCRGAAVLGAGTQGG